MAPGCRTFITHAQVRVYVYTFLFAAIRKTQNESLADANIGTVALLERFQENGTKT
jgi:hypothetical protein